MGRNSPPGRPEPPFALALRRTVYRDRQGGAAVDPPLRPLKLDELTAVVARKSYETLQRARWGDWEFDRKNLTLTNRKWDWAYEVDLERFRTSAEALDWIFRLAGKDISSESLGDLIRAVDFILEPQANLCGGGAEHGPIEPRAKIEPRLREIEEEYARHHL
jgi:hypothetical protein